MTLLVKFTSFLSKDILRSARINKELYKGPHKVLSINIYEPNLDLGFYAFSPLSSLSSFLYSPVGWQDFSKSVQIYHVCVLQTFRTSRQVDPAHAVDVTSSLFIL